MKMISRTSMTSMNGVTLMSCASAKSSSSSSISPSAAAIAYSAARAISRPRDAIEIARQQPPDRARAAADQFEIAFGRARKVIVDDDGRDRRDETDRGREQRFGDAGATTARLVVCAFEMPMKLFMMPQTVPNRPTNGEVAPMVASIAMPWRMERASARTISAKREAARSLMPSSLALSADKPHFLHRGRAAATTAHAVGAPSANCASASDRASAIRASAARKPPPRARQLERLGEEDRPGHQRGEGQADHHRLDQDIGRQEHRPRRQLARLSPGDGLIGRRRPAAAHGCRLRRGSRRPRGRAARGSVTGAAAAGAGAGDCANTAPPVDTTKARRTLPRSTDAGFHTSAQ